MGLFAARPEDPFDWAGLPSEPADAQTDAELLETPPIDPFAITPGTAGASISIVLPGSAPGGATDADPSGDEAS